MHCWYMGDRESDAMWRLHCGSGECLAISSTIGRLMNAVAAAPQRVFLASDDSGWLTGEIILATGGLR